ncbi:hypothetical protein IAE23_25800 [Bacillus sp. S35]|nr:hypothetical protein [Bacillus sp. S35]
MDLMEQVLNKLTELEEKLPNVDIELEVKRAIIQHFHDEGFKQNEILFILNEVLQPWKNKTVTSGCVKHHLKQSKQQI